MDNPQGNIHNYQGATLNFTEVETHLRPSGNFNLIFFPLERKTRNILEREKHLMRLYLPPLTFQIKTTETINKEVQEI